MLTMLGLKRVGSDADQTCMRSTIGLCALICGTIGSFVPDLWGGSTMSLASILFGAAGGVVGVFIGARLSGI